MLFAALSEAARQALQTMISEKEYEYRSEFAKRYYSRGLTEGETRGLVPERVHRQLLRFGFSLARSQ